jgi:3-isopropylmalate dehydrogenase
MMLRYSCAAPEAADAIDAAVGTALDAGLRTPDIRTEGCRVVSTREMGDAVCAAIAAG